MKYLLLISLFSTFLFGKECEKSKIHLNLSLELEVERKDLDLYKYELTFRTTYDHKQYNLCIEKRWSINNIAQEPEYLRYSLSDLAQFDKSKKVLISSPVKIFRKRPGLLFLDRNFNDPNNFFGLSYPKEISIRGRNQWGWLPIIIRNNDSIYYQTEDISGKEYLSFEQVSVTSKNILYRSKLGFKKLPMGVKNLQINYL